MIKKLLGALAILFLFSGCGGGDSDGIQVTLSGGQGGSDTYVLLTDVCPEDPNQLTKIEITCRILERLDYLNDPPEACELITIVDKNGRAHTGIYHSFHKGNGCNL